MAIKINVLQDKRKNSNKLWYGRAICSDTIDTAQLAKRIQANVSVKESDVMAVLIELAEVMSTELANGNKVQLDRFGYFWYGIQSSGALDPEEWNVQENLKKFRINFVLFNSRNSDGKVVSKSLQDGALRAVKYMQNNVLVSSIKKTAAGEEGE
ncbi:MAG: HU family DNA-binding protein [Prevotella sp.]|nr:HU family DNA-binding protein [Prevotella sp.]